MAGEVDDRSLPQRLRDHARLGKIPGDVAIDCARAAETIERQRAILDAVDAVLHTMESVVRQAMLKLKEIG